VELVDSSEESTNSTKKPAYFRRKPTGSQREATGSERKPACFEEKQTDSFSHSTTNKWCLKSKRKRRHLKGFPNHGAYAWTSNKEPHLAGELGNPQAWTNRQQIARFPFPHV